MRIDLGHDRRTEGGMGMTGKKIPESRMLKTKEAAAFLGISKRTLEKWRKMTDADGRPKGPDFHDLDGVIRYDLRELEEYKRRGKKTPGEDFAA
jgi:predicted DNA-binding transcriptional regulator AlpA